MASKLGYWRLNLKGGRKTLKEVVEIFYILRELLESLR